MKVGALVYPTNQGLGILSRSFFMHGLITDPFLVLHSSHPNVLEWYPPGTPSTPLQRLDIGKIRSWASTLDVLMCIETPFDFGLFEHCRRHRVKTMLLVMYECFHAGQAAHPPDLYLCPSTLDLKHFRMAYPLTSSIHLPVPVEVPWRLRERAHTFVHNAGHGSFQDRNGTQLLLEAWPLVKSPARLILRSQGTPNALMNLVKSTRNVDVRIGSASYESLWDEGDAFVFCERWNGACLPLQESLASGMAVIAGDRFPVNEWLPKEMLVPVDHYEKTRIGPPYPEVQAATYDPKVLAEKIDATYGQDISHLSRMGLQYAEENSWKILKPKWLEAIAG